METIKYLYGKYSKELIELKKSKLENKHNFTQIAFDDIESELLYMYVREIKPANIVEFAPFYGWSTFHIISALNENQYGLCTSYDIMNYAPNSLHNCNIDTSRWRFILSDVTDFYHKWNYDEIDFMFIDCDHSASFAKQYCKKVLPNMIQQSKTIFIHDIFHDWKCGEQDVVKTFIQENDICFISPSKQFALQRNEIDLLRHSIYGNDVNALVHHADMNPVVILNPNLLHSTCTIETI
jgi:predicted O-methyltransferase YrrM